jgi:hypothetical protein
MVGLVLIGFVRVVGFLRVREIVGLPRLREWSGPARGADRRQQQLRPRDVRQRR